MARKRESSEAQFARIVQTDADASVTGFYWCGGESWERRDYRAVMLAVPAGPRGKSKSAAIELRGNTPEELVAAMEREGLVPQPASEIAALCESAPASPRSRKNHHTEGRT